MIRKVSSSVLSLSLALALRAAAQEAGEDPLAGWERLERPALVRAVLARNPGLEAARQAWLAAQARVPQERALADPVLSFGAAPLSLLPGRPPGQTLEVRQELPYPGKRELRGRLAEAEAGMALADLDTARLELAAAGLLFEDYRLAHRAIAINRDHLRLVEDLREAAAARYAAGLAMQQDPIQAEIERIDLLQEGIELEAERDTLAAQINALLHRPPGLPLPPPAADDSEPGPPLPDAAALEEAALAARPEMAGRLAGLRARQAGLDLARRERQPDLEVMGSYNSMWEDEEHRWMAGVALSLPVRSARLAAARAEAEARLAQAESDRAQLETEIRAGVRERLARLAEARRRVELYDDRLLPAVRDSIQAARAAFETGQAAFSTVIEAERALRRAQLGREQALADRRRREVEIDRAAGRLPGGPQ